MRHRGWTGGFESRRVIAGKRLLEAQTWFARQAGKVLGTYVVK